MLQSIQDGIVAIQEEDQVQELIDLLKKWQSRGMDVTVALITATKHLETLRKGELK